MTTFPNTLKVRNRNKPALFRLTIGEVIMTDAFIGLGLLVILYGVALNSSFESATTKAKLTEVFTYLPAARIDLQEQLALTGEGFPTLQPVTTRLSGKTSSWGPEWNMGTPGRTLKSITQVEYSLIARGALGKAESSFFLTYTPAVISNGIPGSMLWLCGNRKPPAGWERLPGPAGTDLPAKYLYSVCRDN